MIATHLKDGRAGEPEEVLSSLVRFAVGMSRGMAVASEEEGRQIVARAIKAGKLTQEEGERVLVQISARTRRMNGQFEVRVDEAIQEALRELSRLSNKELDHLRLKTEELERRVEQLHARG